MLPDDPEAVRVPLRAAARGGAHVDPLDDRAQHLVPPEQLGWVEEGRPVLPPRSSRPSARSCRTPEGVARSGSSTKKQQ